MIVNFIYCIDFPQKSDNTFLTDKITGWLLCSNNIHEIRISDSENCDYKMQYGTPRPDVIQQFNAFSKNEKCGFTFFTESAPFNINNKLSLDFSVETTDKSFQKFKIDLDLSPSIIHDFEFDTQKEQFDLAYNHTEEKFKGTLSQYPWLTIRMDITNKCNLKCIMCHYKEKEIYSRHTIDITAEKLKHNLQDIAPYVKHIMLSCGFEPLMSKHFSDILKMLKSSFPHIEIALCTNGMLLNSKARKEIIENNVTHLILSFDGVTKNTLERIRVGADYNKILGNIKALGNLKKKFNRKFPLLFMDFVLMNSNIHEAPAFVGLCAQLGIEIIDFRHMVGNIYFSDDNEMLNNHKGKYNYYRKLIIEESKKYKIDVRLPELYDTDELYISETNQVVDLAEFDSVHPDIQDIEISYTSDKIQLNEVGSEFGFLSGASCLRPFNEIMIIDQEKILPCSYYNEAMGYLDDKNTLYSIFFNEKFKRVRQRKIHSRFDHNCINCPIKSNLLPTEVSKE